MDGADRSKSALKSMKMRWTKERRKKEVKECMEVRSRLLFHSLYMHMGEKETTKNNFV